MPPLCFLEEYVPAKLDIHWLAEQSNTQKKRKQKNENI